MHKERFPFLKTSKVASAINNRYKDFTDGKIKECYIIFDNQAVMIDSFVFSDDVKNSKVNIEKILIKIKGHRGDL